MPSLADRSPPAKGQAWQAHGPDEEGQAQGSLAPELVANAVKAPRGPVVKIAGKQGWVAYTDKKLAAQRDARPMKQAQASRIAQMLQEARSLEDDVYARNASLQHPYRAPSDAAPYPSFAAVNADLLPLTDAAETLTDYDYAALGSSQISRVKRLAEKRRKARTFR